MALLFSTTTIKHWYRHLKKQPPLHLHISFSWILFCGLIWLTVSVVLILLIVNGNFVSSSKFSKDLCTIKKMLLKVHFTSKLTKIVILRETHVYLLVCHVSFLAKGAVRILCRARNHMTDQQIYFSGWTCFVLHTCLGLICDIWTNYL